MDVFALRRHLRGRGVLAILTAMREVAHCHVLHTARDQRRRLLVRGGVARIAVSTAAAAPRADGCLPHRR